MVWIIVWAGLLIVVLYSPIGSPDLYSPSNYYFINQTVQADKGTILHTPKRNFELDNNSSDTELPDISSVSKINYSVGNYQSTTNGSRGSLYAVQTQSYQNRNFSGSGNTGISVSSFLTSGGSHISDGTSGISMTNGISTLSITTNLSNNSITKQSANAYASGSGGTDPGGDPTGDPIPVGDGWGIFILLGVFYSFIKVYINGKNKYPYKIKNNSKKGDLLWSIIPLILITF